MTTVVLGGGLVGTEIAKILSTSGDEFLVITRARREILPGVFSVAADATNSEELKSIAPNASVIFNSLNAPNYTKWHLQFPPLNRAVLNFALTNNAQLVSVSNLYMYEPTNNPIGVKTPIGASGKKGLVRQEMWEETQEFIARGLMAAEVRASDYISRGEQSPLGDRFAALLVRDKAPTVIGNVEAKHSWTSPIDVARTCVEVNRQAAFGEVWHVPTNPPKSFQEVADDIREYLGKNPIDVRAMSKTALAFIGAFVPIVRELKETAYQFDADFIIDDQVTRDRLNIQPTDWDQLIENLVNSYR